MKDEDYQRERENFLKLKAAFLERDHKRRAAEQPASP